MESYKQDQIAKGLAEKNDYLRYLISTITPIRHKHRYLMLQLNYLNRDDSWGPSPDLFRYEVIEVDPTDKTPTSNEIHILESIDVKREKNILTRDKCRVLLKLASDLIEEKGIVMLKVRPVS